MKFHRLVVLFVVAIIALSPITVTSIMAEGPMFRVQLLGENTSKNELMNYDVTIVEEYSDFIICNIDPRKIPQLENKGYGILPFEQFKEIKINKYTLIADEDKILQVSPEIPLELSIPNTMPIGDTYFILQFDLPIKSEWTEQMRDIGVEISSYIPDGGMIVKGDAFEVSKFHDWDRIIGGTPLHPGLKISNKIEPDEEGMVRVTVNLHPNEPISTVRDVLPGESFDGSIDRGYGSVNLECELEQINEIAWLQPVSSITPYIEPELYMDKSREIMGIEARSVDSSPSLDSRSEGIWDYNIKGQGRVVCIQDTGCSTGDFSTLNRDFGIPPRVVGHYGYQSPPAGPDPDQSKAWHDTNGHGTFTSAQVMGDGYNSSGQYAGVAPYAKLVVQKGLGYLNPGLPDAYKHGARVHSNSWGSSINSYTAECSYTDEFVWDNPDMVVCISAGNSGPWTGSLGTPGLTKNNIGVGAAGNNRPSSPLAVDYTGGVILRLVDNTDFSSSPWQNRRVCVTGDNPGEDEFRNCTAVLSGNRIRIDSPLTFNHSSGNRVHFIHAESMARFSSRGPTSDNRIKPDISGPGRNVMGLNRHYNPPFDPNRYESASGTSMSCPNVAGCATLLQQWSEEIYQHLEPSASFVKTLLINGARDIREDYDGTPLFTPDYNGGWGYVDLYDTLYPTAPTRRDFCDYKPGIVTGERVDFPIIAGPGTIKVNIAWSDYPSVVGAPQHLINDLDLIVETPSGEIYRGNQFVGGIGASSDSELNAAGTDTINNVEGVTEFNATEVGQYTISVEGTNVPQSPQPFSMSVEYEAVIPDFDIRVHPDLQYIDSGWRTGDYLVELEPISGFSGDVELSCSLIGPDFTESFNPSRVFLNGAVGTSTMTLSCEDQLDVGVYYFIVRGTCGDIYHEDILTLKVRPGKTYQFDFTKDVGRGGINNPYGDDGTTVFPDDKLGYSLQYNTSDSELFSRMTIEDQIPRGGYYNGVSFPIPTHYSPDGGTTWINERIPDEVGYGYVMRWDLHDIPGSGHLMKLSTGIPGFDNVSDDLDTSSDEVMLLDSNGYPHVVWSNHILGSFPSDDEIFYTRWDGQKWVDLFGNEGISNISNSPSYVSSEPDMVIDPSDNPHIIWVESSNSGGNNRVLYTKCMGPQLTKLDGTAGIDIVSSSIATPNINYYSPRIDQGTNGHIAVVFGYQIPGWWWYDYGFYISRAVGGIWTELDGVTPGAEQIINTTDYVYSPTIEIDSAGSPYLAYEVISYFFWWIWSDNLFTAKWNDGTSSWVNFDGTTPGWENMVPGNTRRHSEPELLIDAGDVPHITWTEDWLGNEDIFYSRFEGGQWVTANGSPGYEQITNTTYAESNSDICLRQTGEPALIWQEQDLSNNIVFSQYNGGWRNLFNSGGVEYITTNISSESITPKVQINSQGVPYFSFTDDRTDDKDVYVTYPMLDFSSANFPGEIVWEGRVNKDVPTDLASIVNNAYVSGFYTDGAYSVETVKTKATTINPFEIGIDVTKTAAQSHVRLNQTVEFKIAVTNTGSVPLTRINVVDIMPKGMELVKSRPVAKESTTGVSWLVNSIAPNSTVHLSVWVKVTDQKLQDTAVQNRVTASSSNFDVSAEDFSSVIVSGNITGFPAPEVTFKSVTSVEAGTESEFELHVWSGNGPFSFEVDWGDGKTTSGNIELDETKTLNHAFNNSGKHKIVCSVIDRFGVTKVIEYNVDVN
jgi:uncharacterized repeat protein (TIGR01451 family)